MREIFFRGKRIDNGEWVVGSLSTEYYKECGCVMVSPNSDECFRVDPETVGQYTGLKGKNGKNGVKIFEGDVVKYSEIDIDGSDLVGLGVISWNQKTACFSISNGVYHGDFCQMLIEEIEVIGNIYDNPELLNGGDGNAEKIP